METKKEGIIESMGVLLKERRMLILLNDLQQELKPNDLYESTLRLKWLEYHKFGVKFENRNEFLRAPNENRDKLEAVINSKEWKEAREIIGWCKRDDLIDLDEEGGVEYKNILLNVNGARFISWPYFINAIGEKLGKFWSITVGILGGLVTSPLIISLAKTIWVHLKLVILRQ